MMKTLIALILCIGVPVSAAEPSCDRAFKNDASVSPYAINLICRALTTTPSEFVKCRDDAIFRLVGDVYEYQLEGQPVGRARLADADAKTPAVEIL